MKNNYVELVETVNHIVPASRAAGTVNGTGIDTNAPAAGYDYATFILLLGTVDAGITGVDLKVQESDDNSTWADITGAAVVSLDGSDDNKRARIGVRLGGRANRKRYVRGVLVVAGTGNALCAVAVSLSESHTIPVAEAAPADVAV
jgi:hypothetical protein